MRLKASSVESLEVAQLKSPALFSTSQKEGKATVSSLKWLLGDEPSITIILFNSTFRWKIPVCTTNLSSLGSTNSCITIVLLLWVPGLSTKQHLKEVHYPLSKYHLLLQTSLLATTSLCTIDVSSCLSGCWLGGRPSLMLLILSALCLNFHTRTKRSCIKYESSHHHCLYSTYTLHLE